MDAIAATIRAVECRTRLLVQAISVRDETEMICALWLGKDQLRELILDLQTVVLRKGDPEGAALQADAFAELDGSELPDLFKDDWHGKE